MKLYYSNKGNRLGDEIQMTALLKYLRHKGTEVDYQDHKGLAKVIFPDNLVSFVNGNNGLEWLNTRNLWIWAPLLRSRGFYTEVKTTPCEPDIDIVMAPVVRPAYNKRREFSKERINVLFDLIVSRWPNSLLVIDAEYRGMVAHDKVVYSENYPQTFDLIRRSRVFLGGDTGTGHYAGAIGHSKMVLLYPDMSNDQWAFQKEVENMAKHFADSDFMMHKWDSTPCCDPSHMTILRIDANLQEIADALEACLLKPYNYASTTKYN